MDEKEKEGISELKTHILYIRENMNEMRQEVKDINNKIDGLPCDAHNRKITELKKDVDDIKSSGKEQSNWSNKKMIAIIGGLASIISAVISAIIYKLL